MDDALSVEADDGDGDEVPVCYLWTGGEDGGEFEDS